MSQISWANCLSMKEKKCIIIVVGKKQGSKSRCLTGCKKSGSDDRGYQMFCHRHLSLSYNYVQNCHLFKATFSYFGINKAPDSIKISQHSCLSIFNNFSHEIYRDRYCYDEDKKVAVFVRDNLRLQCAKNRVMMRELIRCFVVVELKLCLW
jgi:hypothetical protein